MTANVPVWRTGSRAAALALFGADQLAEIDRSVASAPEPSAASLERLRLVLGPIVERHTADTAAARSEAA